MVSGALGQVGTCARLVVVEELSGEPALVREELTGETTVLAPGMSRTNTTLSHVQVKLSERFVKFNVSNFIIKFMSFRFQPYSKKNVVCVYA